MIPTGSSVVPIGGAYMYMTSYWYDYTGYVKKSKPAYFCDNLVYCQQIFIIFDTRTL